MVSICLPASPQAARVHEPGCAGARALSVQRMASREIQCRRWLRWLKAGAGLRQPKARARRTGV
ncbi:hypothetical protein CBM2599_A30053 [Cupriavidus taiwanensis]|uniref:Uncharacterized protein n=1 Tax=Cupriavidus taiwanensis TaxID=164546 RepID=A0A375D019_9BURK|nr:hypothetical protein CBM2599_A30053 [Cupriavidus taiwanensis]SOY88240.1 hypothetical protein CBM2600_A30054 [Cupriavidus taiwanensis]SPD63196.1 protein of unknown function [Cupriavidus taiwanensis]